MTDAEKLEASVRFAEAMGYERQTDYTVNPWMGLYSVTAKDVWIHRKGRPCSDHFGPWTNPADALELADAVFPAWSLDHDFSGEYCFQVRKSQDLIVTDSGNLCDAICDAADAYLKHRAEGAKP